MSLVVEFMGARGVGKSTLVASVREELQRRKLSSETSPIEPVTGTLEKLLEIPSRFRFRRFLERLQLTEPADVRLYERRFLRYGRRLRASSGDSDLVVMDEGMFQLLMMLVIRTGVEEASEIARELKSLVHFPDAVVFVRALPQTIEARRKLRGNAGDLLKPRISERGHRGLRSMERHLLANDSTKHLLVDTDGPTTLTEVAGEVVDRLALWSGQDV